MTQKQRTIYICNALSNCNELHDVSFRSASWAVTSEKKDQRWPKCRTAGEKIRAGETRASGGVSAMGSTLVYGDGVEDIKVTCLVWNLSRSHG